MSNLKLSSDNLLTHVSPEVSKILPPDLMLIPHWITWKAGPIKPDGKFDKLPLGKNGTGVGWQKAPQWQRFEDALHRSKLSGHSGVGIVLPAQLANGAYLIALDFDSVDLVDNPNNLRLQEIKAIHKRLGAPYVEKSPSGKGLRMFVSCRESISQISCPNPLGGKDELFCASGKWVTVTGWTSGGGEIPDASDEIIKLSAEWELNSKSKGLSPSTSIQGKSVSVLGHLTSGWVGWPEHKLRDGDGREEMMLAYAGHLRGKGFMQHDIERLCQEANHLYYDDRLDESVVIDRARRYESSIAASDTEQQNIEHTLVTDFSLLDKIDYTDAGNVAVLHNLMNGNMRYLHELNFWIIWSRNRWQIDSGKGQVHQWLLKVAEHHKKHGDDLIKQSETAGNDAQKENLKNAAKKSYVWSAQCRNKNRLDAMLSIAQRDKRFMLESKFLDNDSWLFGVANGVVDLRTGSLRPDSKNEFVLKRSVVNYNPKTACNRWLQFIEEITSVPDGYLDGKVKGKARPYLATYVHKALGYSMTGRVNEQVMFIANGRGSNGKNVMLDTFKAISGEYCETIPPEVLMASKNERGSEQANPSIRKLAGVRCAISSESKDGQRLDIAVIKRHTGGGYISARGMYENLITFEITHKLWLMTNPKPRLDHIDEAMKGRLHLIPFDMKWNRPGEATPNPTLPDADKDLMDKLKSEYEGILAWLVAGAVKYDAEGLTPPVEVSTFTRDYITSQDILGRWLKEAVETCPINEGCLANELFNNFADFCKLEDEGSEITKATDLGRRLKTLGYANNRTRAGSRYGLKIVKMNEDLDNKPVHEFLETLGNVQKSSSDKYQDLTEDEIESMLSDDLYESYRIDQLDDV